MQAPDRQAIIAEALATLPDSRSFTLVCTREDGQVYTARFVSPDHDTDNAAISFTLGALAEADKAGAVLHLSGMADQLALFDQSE